MTVIRRHIDGVTRDYVLAAGDYQDDGEASVSKVYLALATRLGSCAADPQLGSRFHELKDTSDQSARRAEVFAREAVGRLLRSGEISRFKAAVSHSGVSGRFTIDCEFFNRAGAKQTLSVTPGGA